MTQTPRERALEADMMTALELALDALKVTARESLHSPRATAQKRVEAKRAIRRAIARATGREG